MNIKKFFGSCSHEWTKWETISKMHTINSDGSTGSLHHIDQQKNICHVEKSNCEENFRNALINCGIIKP